MNNNIVYHFSFVINMNSCLAPTKVLNARADRDDYKTETTQQKDKA